MPDRGGRRLVALPGVSGQPLETLTGAKPASRKRLTQQLVEQLLELVSASGSPEVALPAERRLCEQLDVGRNALREALSALEHLGVLETRGKRHVASRSRARAQLVARVGETESSSKLLFDPQEVRGILEPDAAALAAERADDEALAEIERWITLMAEAIERDESVVDYDSAFHVSIARATRNHTMVELVGALTDALHESRELSFRPAQAPREALEDHRRILAAIRAGERDGAAREMRAHLARVEDFIRASIETPDP